MAVSVGSTLLSSDMRSWYTRLNAVTNKFGGGKYAALAVPSAGKIVQASDLNNIVNRFNSIKTDAYLGADAAWTYGAGYSTVSAGQIIYASKGTPIITTLTRLESIRCRNDAKYNNGYTYWKHGNGYSQGAYGNGYSQGAYGNGYSQGAYGNGNSQSSYGNGNSQSSYGNGNSQSSQGNGNNQSANRYDRCYESGKYQSNQCYFWGQSGKGNGNSHSTYWNGDSRSSYGNGNSQSSYGNGYSQGAYGNGYSQGAYGNGYSQGAYSQGDYNNLKGHQTKIDIYNSRTVV
jgi:hypothetical protein